MHWYFKAVSMAKIYFATPDHTVSKSLFGPWVVRRHLTGEDIIVDQLQADQLAKIVKVTRRMGFNVKRDEAAIGVCFSYLIALVEGIASGIMRSEDPEERHMFVLMNSMTEADMVPYVEEMYQRLKG